jgi:hypothetical protein
VQYINEIFAFKAWTKAQFILLQIEELQPQTCQRHHKYQQGKEDSWDVLRKATSITNKIPKERTKFAHSSILHM